MSLVLVILLSALNSAFADVVLEGVHWQQGRREQGRISDWRDVKSIVDQTPEFKSRVRGRLVLKNDGSKDEDGLLLRYSLSARILPIEEKPESSAREGNWVLPFILDEKRVPQIGPGKMIDVSLEFNMPLKLYLQRLSRLGFRPDRLKITVMLEPRRGSKTPLIVEDDLEMRLVSQ